MQKITFIILFVMIFMLCSSQQEQNLLNNQLENIIYSQITNNLEVNIPVLVATSRYIIFFTLEFQNNKILFEETKALHTNIASPKHILHNEIKQLLNCNFIKEPARDTILAIKAYYNDRQLINMTYLDSEGKQVITLKSPDETL